MSHAGSAASARPGLRATLDGYVVARPAEAAGLVHARRLADAADPWDRSTTLHATGSAFAVHPPMRRVLLRRHDLMGSYLHVGGHGDRGERAPLDVALREATEGSRLTDLGPWPDGATAPLHVVVAPVPANPRRGEGHHEHVDIRYVLATAEPERARPEHTTATLRWLAVEEARAEVREDDVGETIDRLAHLLGPR